MGGLDYGTVRCAAFLGLQVVARLSAGHQPGSEGTYLKALASQYTIAARSLTVRAQAGEPL